MTVTGQVSRPPPGRTQWPLTLARTRRTGDGVRPVVGDYVFMPHDDLTGAWVDNRGNVRHVLPDPEWPGDDVWLVMNPAVSRRVGRYDGDTIRGNWDRIPS